MKTYTDEYGEWLVEESGVRLLIKPSEKWLFDNPPPEKPTKPVQLPGHITDAEFAGMMRAAGLI